MANHNPTYGPNYDVRMAEAANSQNIPSVDPRSRVRADSPEIDCNSCDPQLAQYLTVTLRGLVEGSIWEPWNAIPITVKWDTNCTWRENEGSALGVVLSYGPVGWTVKLSPVVLTEEIVWVKIDVYLEDGCNPLQDMGTHITCTSASDPENCTGLGVTSCAVEPSVYSGSWTAWGPINRGNGEAIDPWPSLKQAVTDLADGDKEFTLSWSIMNYGTNVRYKTAGGPVDTNIVSAFDEVLSEPGIDGEPTTGGYLSPSAQDLRNEIQAAFTEWKTLLESVFSPPKYGGQLTVTFDNNRPGLIEGREGPDGKNVASNPFVEYLLDDVTGTSGISANAKDAGVGDIRIGIMHNMSSATRAATVTWGYRDRSRAGHRGNGDADIYLSDSELWRVEGLSEEARRGVYQEFSGQQRSFSIKLVVAHEIGHALGIGIGGHYHDTGRSDPDNFPDPPFPLLADMGGLRNRYYEDFSYFFPDGLKASQWERRSMQELYGYPPEE
jgi:hypothetical protein